MSEPAWLLAALVAPIAVVVVVAMLRGYTVRVTLERNGNGRRHPET